MMILSSASSAHTNKVGTWLIKGLCISLCLDRALSPPQSALIHMFGPDLVLSGRTLRLTRNQWTAHLPLTSLSKAFLRLGQLKLSSALAAWHRQDLSPSCFTITLKTLQPLKCIARTLPSQGPKEDNTWLVGRDKWTTNDNRWKKYFLHLSVAKCTKGKSRSKF